MTRTRLSTFPARVSISRSFLWLWATGALCLCSQLGACQLAGDEGASAPVLDSGLLGDDAGQKVDECAAQCEFEDSYLPEVVPDGCVALPSRLIDTVSCSYFSAVGPLAEVIDESTTFSRVWYERFSVGPGFCPASAACPPALDFARERVIWYQFYVGFVSYIRAPQVLLCGDTVYVKPRLVYHGGEYEFAALVLATIPKIDAPVVFEGLEGVEWVED